MKKAKEFIKGCFKRDFPTLFSRIALIGIIALPLIYSVLYLWSFWDPYERIDNLPVAFVNLDKGGTRNGNENRNVGQELVDELAKDNVLKFEFTSLEEAQNGLNSKRYYAYFVIPENFTQNILSADQQNPQKAMIQVKIREATSVVGSKIIDRVAFEISEKLSHKITQEYFDNVFIQSRDTVQSLAQAVDGASKIKDGIQSAQKGSDSLVNGLGDALDGSNQLVYGLDSAVTGGKKLQDGASDAVSGAQSLESGLGTIYTGEVTLTDNLTAAEAGTAKLASGLQSASSSAGTITGYLQSAASGSSQISAGLQSSSDGAGSLAGGLSALTSSLPTLQTGVQGAASLASGIKQGADNSAAMAGDAESKLNGLMTTYPDLANDPTAQGLLSELGTLSQAQTSVAGAADQLSGVVGQLSGGLSSTGQGISQLASGASNLKTGIDSLKSGSDSLTANLTQIAQGEQQLASGIETASENSSTLDQGLQKLVAGSSSLAAGINTAYSGSKDLSKGLGTLSTGEKSIVDGLSTLDDGGWQLKNGITKLKDGGQELSDGLSDASSGSAELYQKLQDGYETSKSEVDLNKTKKEEPVLSDPVTVDEQYVDHVQTYGTGFTPYFIPLAMWVGALSVFVVFGVISNEQARKYSILQLSGEIFRRYLLYAFLGVIQSFVLGFVLIHYLGLQPVHPELFYEFVVAIALLSIAIMMFIDYTFVGAAGSFVGVILLMLQLTSSGGTYPIETSPQFFRMIAPYLPMTYAVSALRDIISGSVANVDSTMRLFWIAIGILLVATVAVKLFESRVFKSRARKENETVDQTPKLLGAGENGAVLHQDLLVESIQETPQIGSREIPTSDFGNDHQPPARPEEMMAVG
jgi:putative membrane protein